MHRSQKRTTSHYPWHQQNLMTWHETWNFPRSLLNCWIHISKRNICWAPGTTYNWHCDREREIRKFFTFQDKSSLVYCNSIARFIKSIFLKYDVTEWRLLIHSCCRSLKAVLLHNGNSFSSIPTRHSVQMKETIAWIICCQILTTRSTNSLSVGIFRWLVGLVLGLPGEYIVHPCFLCLLDSWADDQH